jgi:hypothetical protein
MVMNQSPGSDQSNKIKNALDKLMENIEEKQEVIKGLIIFTQLFVSGFETLLGSSFGYLRTIILLGGSSIIFISTFLCCFITSSREAQEKKQGSTYSLLYFIKIFSFVIDLSILFIKLFATRIIFTTYLLSKGTSLYYYCLIFPVMYNVSYLFFEKTIYTHLIIPILTYRINLVQNREELPGWQDKMVKAIIIEGVTILIALVFFSVYFYLIDLKNNVISKSFKETLFLYIQKVWVHPIKNSKRFEKIIVLLFIVIEVTKDSFLETIKDINQKYQLFSKYIENNITPYNQIKEWIMKKGYSSKKKVTINSPTLPETLNSEASAIKKIKELSEKQSKPVIVLVCFQTVNTIISPSFVHLKKEVSIVALLYKLLHVTMIFGIEKSLSRGGGLVERPVNLTYDNTTIKTLKYVTTPLLKTGYLQIVPKQLFKCGEIIAPILTLPVNKLIKLQVRKSSRKGVLTSLEDSLLMKKLLPAYDLAVITSIFLILVNTSFFGLKEKFPNFYL